MNFDLHDIHLCCVFLCSGVWWNHIGPILPVLRKYALRILSQPCKCSLNTKPTAFEVAQTKKMNSKKDNVSHRVNFDILKNLSFG